MVERNKGKCFTEQPWVYIIGDFSSQWLGAAAIISYCITKKREPALLVIAQTSTGICLGSSRVLCHMLIKWVLQGLSVTPAFRFHDLTLQLWLLGIRRSNRILGLLGCLPSTVPKGIVALICSQEGTTWTKAALQQDLKNDLPCLSISGHPCQVQR